MQASATRFQSVVRVTLTANFPPGQLHVPRTNLVYGSVWGQRSQAKDVTKDARSCPAALKNTG